MITPTEREARISSRNDEVGFVVLTERLRINSKAKNILFKMGEEGLLIHADDREGAMNSSPRDVAGAGNSLLIFSTNCCLYSEINNSIFF